MTKLGTLIHNLGLALHLTGYRITNANLQQILDDGEQVANVYNEVTSETAAITDPAARTEAICRSVINHKYELPESVQASVEPAIIALCAKIVSLPLGEVETIVKAELAKAA